MQRLGSDDQTRIIDEKVTLCQKEECKQKFLPFFKKMKVNFQNLSLNDLERLRRR